MVYAGGPAVASGLHLKKHQHPRAEWCHCWKVYAPGGAGGVCVCFFFLVPLPQNQPPHRECGAGFKDNRPLNINMHAAAQIPLSHPFASICRINA